jgi:hypothetical protein
MTDDEDVFASTRFLGTCQVSRRVELLLHRRENFPAVLTARPEHPAVPPDNALMTTKPLPKATKPESTTAPPDLLLFAGSDNDIAAHRPHSSRPLTTFSYSLHSPPLQPR